MSYILEALKKSDQQRQRGTTPTLRAAQINVAAPRRPTLVYYGLLAAVLLAVGITIGWLRPWQPEQTPHEIVPVVEKSPVTISRQTALAPPDLSGKIAQQVLNATPAAQPVPVADAMKLGAAAPAAERAIPEKNAPAKTSGSADVVQEQRVISMSELPLQIQQEIPAMAIQLHAYSTNPGERLVSINFLRLREGGSLTPGLTLEQITPDGMIFSYKGYRFQRGVR